MMPYDNDTLLVSVVWKSHRETGLIHTEQNDAELVKELYLNLVYKIQGVKEGFGVQ